MYIYYWSTSDLEGEWYMYDGEPMFFADGYEQYAYHSEYYVS